MDSENQRRPVTALTESDLKLNFDATFFADEIRPFKITVHQAFLDLTKAKVSLTRIIEDLEGQEEYADGPPKRTVQEVANFWKDHYDWRTVEARLNQDFDHFTTTVQTPVNTYHRYPDPVPLHFVHHRSNRPDAIPLLFVHGWPGSFLEVESLIEPLTNPPDPKLPAFHIVAPSIPGYGFSPSPRKPGFGYRQAGATFRALMLKLGYVKYVFQGGDAGDLINRYAAIDFPDNVVSGVSNFWVTPPREDDLARHARGQTSEDESYLIGLYQGFTTYSWGYGYMQQTRPLRLAIGLTDSPVGLAMWIYDGIRRGVTDEKVWTPEVIITWTMMHWINGPYGPFSLYKNGAKVSRKTRRYVQYFFFFFLHPFTNPNTSFSFISRTAPSQRPASTNFPTCTNLSPYPSFLTTSGTEPPWNGRGAGATSSTAPSTTEVATSRLWMRRTCWSTTSGGFSAMWKSQAPEFSAQTQRLLQAVAAAMGQQRCSRTYLRL